jgi:hypothetical protein
MKFTFYAQLDLAALIRIVAVQVSDTTMMIRITNACTKNAFYYSIPINHTSIKAA